MRAGLAALRGVLAAAAGIIAFLGTMTASCNAVEVAHSWERCQSWLGNPIIEWPGGDWSPVFPLLSGVAVGLLVWWLLGFTSLRSR